MLKKNEPDWIEHDGSSECPVPAGHDVEVEYSWGKTYRCDNPELRNWPRITHYRDWTAFEQQRTSAGEVPEWALERVYELWQDTSLLEAFARYIAAHEPEAVDPLAAALASIDIGLSDHELQKLKDMGVTVTAPARGEGA